MQISSEHEWAPRANRKEAKKEPKVQTTNQKNSNKTRKEQLKRYSDMKSVDPATLG